MSIPDIFILYLMTVNEAMALPLVTIVGRPNVGKSTLFNRLIKRKQAIVDDRPGVTRDRNYAVCDWTGYKFEIVDTGGYIPQAADNIEAAVREQVEYSIERADYILFVLDLQSDVTDIDLAISRILRKSGKPYLPVINKVDKQTLEPDADRFYALGTASIVKVAAKSGKGIGDLLDTITLKLRERYPETALNNDAAVKIAVVGKPNVGKSSYVNALLGEQKMIVSKTPGTTRDAVDSYFHYEGKKICLIDTAGLRKKSKHAESIEFFSSIRTYRSIDRCDVVFLLIDVQDGLQRQDLRIMEYGIKQKKGILLLFNKWDLVPQDDMSLRKFEKAILSRLRINDYIPWMTVSALQQKRIYKSVGMGLVIYEELHKKIATAELNKVVQKAVKSVSPPSYNGKKLTIKYVSQVHTNPPVLAFFANEPRGFPAPYKRYLEKRIREHFGFTGVPLSISYRKK